MTDVYQLHNVTKRYRNTTALRDLTLNITDNVTAIIGYSGAGKTTLLKILAGLETPSFGSIDYKGQGVTSRNRQMLRQEVTMLFQDPIFFNRSVVDNVAYGLRRRGLDKRDAHQRALQALTPLGLGGFETRKAMSLSGGEQQRVALARAIVLDPKVLLLDEPTSNLDPRNTRIIINLVKKFAQKGHIIVATHVFQHVIELADRIAVLINGELQQFDAPEKIFHRPQSREIARFVGIENILQGKVIAHTNGVARVNMGEYEIYVVSNIDHGPVNIFIRPESIILSIDRFKSSALNNIEGQIAEIIQRGSVFQITLDNELTAFITKQSLEELELKRGKTVYASFKATAVHIQETERPNM